MLKKIECLSVNNSISQTGVAHQTSFIKYDYQGNQISFRVNGSLMVCATNMAKPFGKKPIDWLKYQQSQEYLTELSKVRKITLADLVLVIKGGANPGTWFHEDVALEFARWLSPAFAIWCNDRIKELMKYGITATPQTIEDIITQPDNAIKLLTELKKERNRTKSLEVSNHTYQSEYRRLVNLHCKDDAKIAKLEKRIEHLEHQPQSPVANGRATVLSQDQFKQMMTMCAELGRQQFISQNPQWFPTRPEYFTIAGYARLHGFSVNLSMASKLGLQATKICYERGHFIDDCPDPRFGRVNMYPKSVLDEVFEQLLTKGGIL